MDIPKYLSCGEMARLIPVTADSNKEVRAVSILLATLSAVPAFQQKMLGTLGIRTGIKTKIDCCTEIVFHSDESTTKSRPDGLIILDGGRGRAWSCLIEAKIKNEDLKQEQVEKYIALAKKMILMLFLPYQINLWPCPDTLR